MPIQEITAIFQQIVEIIQQVFSIILTIGIGTGLLTGPATDKPILFQDSENCNMAFVALADTQMFPTEFTEYYLECGFEDMENADGEFDALVIAGDISEMGDKETYSIVFNTIDKSLFAEKPLLLATGNHDIRTDYKGNTKCILEKTGESIGKQIDKAYYSYDVEGYTFIVMGSDSWQFEKADISDEQLVFLDNELKRATKDGKPAFVICHQPLENTHGLPEVWENGGIGKDSDEIKEILLKYKNVFYLNGHLHDGVYEKSLEVFSEENGVYSVNLPAYGKDNDYGEFSQTGLGTYVETYDDRVVFTARDFQAGKELEGYTYTFYLK